MKCSLQVCLLLVALLFGCSANSEYVPRRGDLVFVVDSSTDFSKAITDATAWNDSLKYSHVAIVDVQDDRPCVLEASSEHGVVCTPWDEFVSASAPESAKPGIVVMRLTVPYPVGATIDRARSHLGRPYDWSFRPNNDNFYCSELVYESYLSADSVPLFTARPMNFRDSKGNIPAYWIELFDRLGEPVPQGVMGTNPNDMAKEPILKVVYP